MLRMSLYPIFIIFLSMSNIVFAQQARIDTPPSLIDQLFQERDPSIYPNIFRQAQEAKISIQTLFEADFLFAIDSGDNLKITRLLETHDFNKIHKNFNTIRSQIFASKDDFEAVTFFIKAIKAFELKQDQEFKKYIKQAFWLSPEQAPVFATYIEKTKLRNLISSYNLPSTFRFHLQQTNTEIKNWKNIIQEQTGLLLFCYSPWSNQSMLSTESAKLIHELCKSNNIAHLQHNIETSTEALADNADYVSSAGIKNAHFWTTETLKVCLIETLRIKQTPTLIEFNQEGSITFHGDVSGYIKHLSAKTSQTNR